MQLWKLLLDGNFDRNVFVSMDILKLELLTDDLDGTERFYSKVLGLPVKDKTINSTSFIAGSSTLIFERSFDKHPTYHFAFNIPCNKIKEAVDWAKSKLKLIESEGSVIIDFVNWNARSIYFMDNNKNVLEFIARSDLNNQSTEPFSTNAILNISEIGIVTGEPLKLAEQYINQYDMEYFKEFKNDKFVSLGDNNGLLIIVAADRNWFPTNQRSEAHPVNIEMLNSDFVNPVTLKIS